MLTISDDFHIIIYNLMILQEVFNVAQSIEPTVVRIRLSRNQELIALYRIL